MRGQPHSDHVAEAVIVLLALGLAFVAGLAGWAVGHASRSAGTATVPGTVAVPTATGHSGAGLPAHEFGDPVNGARLFATKGCADCHSYAGKGGTDAPPLDYMKGHLSAREIANMSGQIWNHLPAMLQHFRKEGIPVPTFSGYEMADLIAYLHSGSGGGSGTTTGAPTSEMQMPPAKAKPGNAAAGKQVFLNSRCGGCHTFAAAGSKGAGGPNLDTSLASKSATFVRQSIVEPNATVAKGYEPNVMPSTYGKQLSKQQLADVIAFLARKR